MNQFQKLSHCRDDQLLVRWRDGDAAAGSALLGRYYQSVERYFSRRLRIENVADLVQDTFIACIEGRDRVTQCERFRVYLFSTAHNVFCKHLRSGYRASSAPERDLTAAEVESIAATPDHASSEPIGEQEIQMLYEGLRAIPAEYRDVLELYYWKLLSTLDISKRLDIPRGTVRSRLHRGRELLKGAVLKLSAVNATSSLSTRHADASGTDNGE